MKSKSGCGTSLSIVSHTRYGGSIGVSVGEDVIRVTVARTVIIGVIVV